MGHAAVLEQLQQADRLPSHRKCLYANFKHWFSISTFFFFSSPHKPHLAKSSESLLVHEISVMTGLKTTTVCVCVLRERHIYVSFEDKKLKKQKQKEQSLYKLCVWGKCVCGSGLEKGRRQVKVDSTQGGRGQASVPRSDI